MIVQSVPVSEKKKGESQVYRHPITANNGLIKSDFPGWATMQDQFLARVNKQGPNSMLATRNPLMGNKYSQKTSSEVFEIVKNLGSAIIAEGLVNIVKEYLNYELQMFAIQSKNREEWAYCDFASMLFGFTPVPFYDALGIKAIQFILEQTNLQTIFCSNECLTMLAKEKSLGKVKNIVCFDPAENVIISKLASLGIRYQYFWDLLKVGKQSQITYPKKLEPQHLFSIIYTSGTTGNPKGAMVTHENMIASLSTINNIELKIITSDRYISYLPLAHIYERCIFHWMLIWGSTIGFYGGNIFKIKDDIAEFKPTIFCSAPRLFNKFYDALNNNFNQVGCCKKMLIKKGLASKLNRLKTKQRQKHKLWDLLVFNKVKKAFGGKMRLMYSTSAPISREVMEFLKVTMCCNFIEAYGQTESCGHITTSRMYDILGGHVGGVVFTNEIKLVDIPEMSYTSEDKDENGQPMPRGEIYARGYNIIPGYQKDPEKTKETLDTDNWLKTGDVGLILPNGALRIIDRRKNIFKLSHGEYIAPEKLEIVYGRCKAIEEIFVYGESLYNHIIAIAVPKKNFVMEKVKELNLESDLSFEDAVKKEKIKSEVLNELCQHAKSEGLLKIENIQKLALVCEGFQAAGLLTTTFKLKRFEAKNYFKDTIQRLYEEPTIVLE